MRMVFLGTPSFAVPSLEALAGAGHEIVAVYTQPDRPKGRGQRTAPSPVKEAALRLGLTMRQPDRIRRPEVVEELAAMRTDMMVVVGYGQIIPQAILDLPPLGIVNVHASLLPKYRGAAPLQWAVANGEEETGVTTMRINAGLDTGDMLLAWRTPIHPEETAVELGERLSVKGAGLLLRTLDGLAGGSLQPEPQDDSQASYAPILKKEDGAVDWTWPARKLDCRIRGFQPWPGCVTSWRGQALHLWRARVAPERQVGAPGEVVAARRRLLAACGEGTALELLDLQLEGRNRIPAEAFLNGQRPSAGERLGEVSR